MDWYISNQPKNAYTTNSLIPASGRFFLEKAKPKYDLNTKFHKRRELTLLGMHP